MSIQPGIERGERGERAESGERPATAPGLIAIRDPRDPNFRPHPEAGWRARLELLRTELRRMGHVVVAYSGGVDSSVLLAVAHEQLGPRALGVIGVSDSYAAHELELALAQGARIGARVETVPTGELADADFASNPVDRCYHCKHALYSQLARVAAREGADAAAREGAEAAKTESATVCDGTIHDDLTDHRPGRRAAGEHAVRSPLAELGFSKRDVRAVADSLGLASADKPASPCLASRIPYGTPITRENLSQVERAEALLRGLGFRELRVRHHGETARLEVPIEQLSRLTEPQVRALVVDGLKGLGYRWVTLDLEGLRSGNLNPLRG